ncbi:MAG TPA: type II secretion system protein [Gammaproteobacteria bacterium]|nr:type II secretion system protein [Gammaproteobacteria bacterium]
MGGGNRGFTLVELVVTLAVSAVVVSFAAMFITGPVQGFNDQARRVELVGSANAALARMGRDIRRALPNSIRVAGSGPVSALELLGTVDGARYRHNAPGTPDQILDLSAADGSFNVIGPFTQVAKPFSSTSHHLAIYNVGVTGADAYELANVMTPAGTQIAIAADAFAGEDRVTVSPPFRFAFGSPTQRVYLVDGPVSYVCDAVAGSLTRYTGYTIADDHSARDSGAELLAAGASASLVAGRITGCGFSYSSGTSERAGLVTIAIAVGEQGETISLLDQVHVDNAP